MPSQSVQHPPTAALDEYLDCLLQEELATLRWSQADVEKFCASPLPGLIKAIVISAVTKAWVIEKQREISLLF